MSHGTEQHLEHAEHAQHHALNPFDRRVAISMAIIAAVLAGVTLLSHRGHTDTLRYQAEANSVQTEAARLQTLSNVHHTKASDMWAFYQAKNIRSHLYQTSLKLLGFVAARPETDKAQEASRKYWSGQVERYEGKPGKTGKRREGGDLAELRRKAEAEEKLAQEYQERAETKLGKAEEFTHQSHHVHAAVNWVDSGHLAVELALVLCAVAVLTKQRGFWFAGILVGMVGAGLAGFGVFTWLFTHPAGYH
jgi:hypothetical protein